MKIRRLVYKSGQIGWQVDLGLVGGRRVQTAFPTKKEATAELKK